MQLHEGGVSRLSWSYDQLDSVDQFVLFSCCWKNVMTLNVFLFLVDWLLVIRPTTANNSPAYDRSPT